MGEFVGELEDDVDDVGVVRGFARGDRVFRKRRDTGVLFCFGFITCTTIVFPIAVAELGFLVSIEGDENDNEDDEDELEVSYACSCRTESCSTRIRIPSEVLPQIPYAQSASVSDKSRRILRSTLGKRPLGININLYFLLYFSQLLAAKIAGILSFGRPGGRRDGRILIPDSCCCRC